MLHRHDMKLLAIGEAAAMLDGVREELKRRRAPGAGGDGEKRARRSALQDAGMREMLMVPAFGCPSPCINSVAISLIPGYR